MADYFIALGGVQQGPFPSHELPARGMRADSLVWCEGMGDWQRAEQVPELAAMLPRQQPSMPPPFPQQAYAPPPMAGYAGGVPYNTVSSNRVAAGVCAILLGGLGIHKFVLGYNTAGVITLLITLLTCGAGAIVMHVIGIIEGIIYLTKSEAEFHQVYVVERRSWF